jgi:hypothetical protein
MLVLEKSRHPCRKKYHLWKKSCLKSDSLVAQSICQAMVFGIYGGQSSVRRLYPAPFKSPKHLPQPVNSGWGLSLGPDNCYLTIAAGTNYER